MDNYIPHKRDYNKYNTDEERKEGFRQAQLRYTAKPWRCESCNVTIRLGNKTKHLRSKKHVEN